MPDLEKVIKGLECCWQYEGEKSIRCYCPDCPYFTSDCSYFTNNIFCDCRMELNNDAIALLKGQVTKTGHWIDSAGYDKCSNCGTEYSDLYPDYGNTHFCPNCGAKMTDRR